MESCKTNFSVGKQLVCPCFLPGTCSHWGTLELPMYFLIKSNYLWAMSYLEYYLHGQGILVSMIFFYVFNNFNIKACFYIYWEEYKMTFHIKTWQIALKISTVCFIHLNIHFKRFTQFWWSIKIMLKMLCNLYDIKSVFNKRF